LTLNGANEYQGGTTVTGGTLEVNGSVVSAITVQAGTLGGTGSSTAAVTVGTGTGTGATLAPGRANIGTFTTTRALALRADATYAVEFNNTTNTMDKAVANGLTLSNPRLVLTNLATSGTLAAGTSYVIVNNTSTTAVAGTFLNLPEGSTVTVGTKVFRVSYVGGTGNDVTLTTTTAGRTVLAQQDALSQEVQVFPNPTHGHVFISLPASLKAQAVKATLLNALGQKVQQTTLAAGAAGPLPLLGLTKGLYTLRLETAIGSINKRLLVE
jgi:uncharacterized protein with beta-barrel porin domain